MSASKAATYLSLLDTARCNGDWSSVPELVRKLTKHGGAARKCITETALLDHDTSPQRLSHSLHKNATIVVSASALSKASATQASTANAASTLVSISALAQTFEEEIARFKADNAAAAAQAEEVDATAKRKSKKYSEHIVTSEEEIYQAEVTLAYLHHLLQAHRIVLQILPPQPPPRDQITQEWTKVCAIKALCLKGMAQEALKMKEEAIQTYKGLPIPDFSSGVGSSGSEAIWWIRKTLSRFAIASWELFEGVESPDTPREAHADDEYDEEEGLDELDAAHAALNPVREETEETPSSTESSSNRPELKRVLSESGLIGAFRAYHAFSMSLAEIRPISATTAASTLMKSDKSSAEDDASRKTIYETYLKVVSKYLKTQIDRDEEISDDLRAEISSIEKIYESLLLKVTKFPHASKVNQDVLMWVDTVVANWAILGSQGSDAGRVVEILYRAAGKTFHSPRILRHLFITLTAMGNFHDAHLSLDTYITLIKRGKARIEKEKSGAHSTGEEDFDTDNQILTTCVQGICFLAKYFPEESTKAMEIASTIKTWIFEWKTEDHSILGLVWRGIGLANASWSHQTVESTQRAEIQDRAIAAFRKSLEYQPEGFEALFDLGLMYAETRDIDSAIDAIRGVAEMQEKCIPAWHLLTLLLTSKGDWDTALTVSEAIFQLIDENEQLTLGLGNRDGLVEIKITQLAIIEMLEGPESAVNLADELLGLYTRLFPGVLSSAAAVSMRDSVMDADRPITRGRAGTTGGMPAIQVTDVKGASDSEVVSKRSGATPRPTTRGSSLGRNSLRKKRRSMVEPLTDDEKSKEGPNKLHRTPSQKSAKSTKSSKSLGAKSAKSHHTSAGKSISPSVAAENVGAQAVQVNRPMSQTPSVLSEKNNIPHNLPAEAVPSPIKQLTDDRPLLNRPPYLREPILSELDEKKRVEGILKKIWLVVAGLYRRAEMFEDSKVAVEEAAGVAEGGKVEGGVDADVWAERGFLSLSQNQSSDAQKHFETALAYSPDHALGIVGLSRVLLLDEKNSTARDRASGLLQTLTKLGNGWDMSEAWFELAREYEMSGGIEKAKDIYWWVVKLEDTRGVRGWACVVPKVL
ncbi:hypothetical protein TWF102_000389 [Orbilia oligospora]|uniref:Uncharacterized protein n=2 Tax=Orbilia oligospora TaxID=2813651 RepID=A0A7C8JB51_ORBOL|nr:hypothetical protein TWF102_000389 [Orbilia oligospora]KAF3115903.1 hypothetical protein TWF103_010137 [Orbilia oligospora]KAF3149601.1 hypothetical protein TWF594_010706 [Orbilia oligospora]